MSAGLGILAVLVPVTVVLLTGLIALRKRALKSSSPWFRWILGIPGSKVRIVEENHYGDLRSKALSVKSELLGLEIERAVPYGAVMEWPTKGVTCTVVAFITGDSSVYLSSGHMFIGGYAIPTVKSAALRFVSEQATLLHVFDRSDAIPVVDPSECSFYLLCREGRYRACDDLSTLESGRSPLASAFVAAHGLLSEWQKESKSDIGSVPRRG